MTRHNGRAGTHGTYNPKHNDRSFDLANSEHIDPERAKGNIYWDCFHGFRSALDPQDPDDLAATFSEVERQFYESSYSEFIEKQNERNAKIRHTERNRSIPDLLSSRKTCPEETIYQLGTLDEHASAEDLPLAHSSSRWVFAEQTAEKLQKLLAGVVAEGTGQQAAPSEGTAAGKTGTAQTGQFRDGEELKNYWFAGFYPAEKPRWTIVVMQDAQTEPEVSSAAIFARLCDALSAGA